MLDACDQYLRISWAEKRYFMKRNNNRNCPRRAEFWIWWTSRVCHILWPSHRNVWCLLFGLCFFFFTLSTGAYSNRDIPTRMYAKSSQQMWNFCATAFDWRTPTQRIQWANFNTFLSLAQRKCILQEVDICVYRSGRQYSSRLRWICL